MNYQETLNFLFQQLPMYQREGKAAFKKDLNNILALVKILDNPHEKFKSIHIAGTNGKGSTAHMLASIFQQAGYKTGLYTSPHLKDFRERIRVNGRTIDEETVVRFVTDYFENFRLIRPSFFEWTVALAFQHFAKEKVDIAIVETGLGGRLDSTNILSPELSIITNIGLDHQEMLGNTKAEIAREKAGIIKTGTPVVIGNESGQRKLFNSTAELNHAPIYYAESIKIEHPLNSNLKGKYQAENLRTVYQSYLVLKERGWRIDSNDLEVGLNQVTRTTGLRGRYEKLQEKPLIIADTAHNYEALELIIEQLLEEEYDQLHMVMGFVMDKNIDRLLSLLPQEANYCFCMASIPRAMTVESVIKAAEPYKLSSKGFSSVKDALDAARSSANSEDLIFVGGSTFVVAEIL